MKKHMNTTTGTSTFSIVEHVNLKQHILEKHSKSNHTIKDTENWHFTCEKCEKPMKPTISVKVSFMFSRL